MLGASVCVLCFGCALDESPQTDSDTRAQMGSTDPAVIGNAADAPIGAGMPIVPIHRADGGELSSNSAPAGQDSRALDASTQPPTATADAQLDASGMRVTRPGQNADDANGTLGANGANDAATPNELDAAARAPKDAKDAQARTAPSTADAQSPTRAAGDAQAPHAADASTPTTPRPADASSTPNTREPELPTPIHRYDFSGTGTTARDLIGGADAELRGSTRLDQGKVVFHQDNTEGVVLPNGLLADLEAFTLLAWVELDSSACWQRIFDFHHLTNAPGTDRSGSEPGALYLTPSGCPGAVPAAGYITQASDDKAMGSQQLELHTPLQIGLMWDARSESLRLIIDGAVRTQVRARVDLDVLALAQGRLGRSYSPSDPVLDGSIDELRLYAQTLDSPTLAEIFRRGPDHP